MSGITELDYDVNIQLAENEDIEIEEELADDEYEKKRELLAATKIGNEHGLY